MRSAPAARTRSLNRRVTSPTEPSPTGRPSTEVSAVTCVVEHTNASEAPASSARVNARSSTASPADRASSSTTARVTPASTQPSAGCVRRTPSITAKAFVDEPSVMCVPASPGFARSKSASTAPRRFASVFAIDAGSSISDLIPQRCQRTSSTTIASPASIGPSASSGSDGYAIIVTEGTAGSGCTKLRFTGPLAAARVTCQYTRASCSPFRRNSSSDSTAAASTPAHARPMPASDSRSRSTWATISNDRPRSYRTTS